MKGRGGCSHLSILLVLLVMAAAACTDRSSPTTPAATTAVAGANGQALGSVQFPTSCAAAAQPLLERGLALLHNMAYLESERVFAEAADVDAECALAYWGQAMTRVHPLWPDVPTAEDVTRAQRLLE